MYDDHVPGIGSRRLGRRLRELREAERISCDRAARELGRPAIWLVQVEAGQEPVTDAELRRILDLYPAAGEGVRGDLLELARRAGGPSWLSRYAGVLSGLERDLIASEAEASRVRAFGLRLVPDLLRTEEYARAILTATLFGDGAMTVDQGIALMLSRQLHQPASGPRRMHVILDEAAIDRRTGDRDMMHGQLRHLYEQAGEEHTVFQLVPREVGAHVGLDGPFHILDFADPGEPSVSVSHSALGVLLAYTALDDHFEKLERTALSPADSLFMLERALEEF